MKKPQGIPVQTMRLNEWSIARKACEKSQSKGIDAGKIFSP
jgi:hypothetical protein